MSICKTFGLAMFATIGLLDETARSAHAQCLASCATAWSDGSVIGLGPGIANSINDAGQVVGWSGS